VGNENKKDFEVSPHLHFTRTDCVLYKYFTCTACVGCECEASADDDYFSNKRNMSYDCAQFIFLICKLTVTPSPSRYVTVQAHSSWCWILFLNNCRHQLKYKLNWSPIAAQINLNFPNSSSSTSWDRTVIYLILYLRSCLQDVAVRQLSQNVLSFVCMLWNENRHSNIDRNTTKVSYNLKKEKNRRKVKNSLIERTLCGMVLLF
jgi:hypothetical protein